MYKVINFIYLLNLKYTYHVVIFLKKITFMKPIQGKKNITLSSLLSDVLFYIRKPYNKISFLQI